MSNKTKGFVLIALISFFLGTMAHEVISISTVDEYKQHVKGDKPLIAMFTASWCGPCQHTKPHFIELAKENTDVTFCLIDIDNKELRQLTSAVAGVPTFVGTYKNKEFVRTAGGRPLQALRALVENFKAQALGQKTA